jgi:octaheme c-type cytochrome (tetrathionate reductase family)
MKGILALALAVLLLPACGGSDDQCDACDANACMTCDAGTCVFTCDTGMTCEDGTCMAPEVATCDPACGQCQSCDTSGATPVCVDNCAAGLVCNDGACEVPVCEPTCGVCEKCDTSGSTPACVDLCDPGLECANGLCVAPTCDPTCGPCEVCDITSGTPTCVSSCAVGQMCTEVGCVRRGLHSGRSELNGPFADGPAVTAKCIGCHPDEATDFMQTSHWNWEGVAPGAGGAIVGKGTLVNNFCTGIASNWPRCTSCHAGYGWEDADFFDTATENNIDCLVCHADPASGYVKAPPGAGAPAAGVNLVVAAKSVGKTTRASCGACHYNGGGGDNIKKGDLGSALTDPSQEADFHMGSGFTCATCHEGANHKIKGTGVNTPVLDEDSSLACTECHLEAPHPNPVLNNHALDVACQTCHIPAFSRQQPTKTMWDWSQAGNRTIGNNGVETGIVVDEEGNEHEVHTYDAKKGRFEWGMNIRPTYAWYDHNIERITTDSTFTAGLGTSETEPIALGKPTATKDDANAKIYPFKVMVGRQPAHASDNYMIIPHVFGTKEDHAFWPSVPAAEDYTPELVHDLWTTALDIGRKAMVGPPGTSDTIGTDDWAFRHTEMYLAINHEVAPRTEALQCQDCHRNAEFDFRALGYTCDDPWEEGDPGTACGLRHQ